MYLEYEKDDSEYIYFVSDSKFILIFRWLFLGFFSRMLTITFIMTILLLSIDFSPERLLFFIFLLLLFSLLISLRIDQLKNEKIIKVDTKNKVLLLSSLKNQHTVKSIPLSFISLISKIESRRYKIKFDSNVTKQIEVEFYSGEAFNYRYSNNFSFDPKINNTDVIRLMENVAKAKRLWKNE